MTTNFTYPHPKMSILVDVLERERYFELFFIAVLLVMGITICTLYAYETIGMMVAIGGIGIGLFAIKLIYRLVVNWDVKNKLLWKQLTEEADDIVWVYSVETQLMPFGIMLYSKGVMYFKLADGNDISISLPPHKIKPISQMLNELLPHASFGFTEERDQWYTINPLMLLRSEEEQNAN